LQLLFLDGNQLASVPSEIGDLTDLKRLSLGDNQLTSLPTEVFSLSDLELLDIRSNQLASLPAEIGQLTSLQFLSLNANQLSSVPSEIGNLTNLRSLDLSSNQLTSLPIELFTLFELEQLTLNFNQLTSLPAEIGNLTRLQYLTLIGNQLTNLPPEIGNLTDLRDLYLYGNPSLAGPLPGSLTQLTRLEVFLFYGTQLCVPNDPAFQSWLGNIVWLEGTGLTCLGSPPPPSTSAPLRLSIFTSETRAGSVTLYWETEAEADNLGFNLYRLAAGSDSPIKVNPELISALGNATTGATYQFADRPGSGDYIYLIKNVDQEGVEHLRAQLEVVAEGYLFYIPALAAP
jgi:Leucine-rich repeat (LRR) protein